MLLAATMENTSPDDDVESLRKLSHDIHGTFENRITYIGQDGTVHFLTTKPTQRQWKTTSAVRR